MEQYTINILNSYPKDILELDISNKNIVGLLDLYDFMALEKLICSHNQITYILNIRKRLKYLDCSFNKISILDPLNDNIEYFNYEF